MNVNVKPGIPGGLPAKDVRKRKMLMVLPIFMVPFITLGFWSLGGGKGTASGEAANNSGLNPRLPDPKMKNEKLDKLGFYDKADKDSMKRMEEMRNDPFYSDHSSIEKANDLEQVLQQSQGKYHESFTVLHTPSGTDPHVAEERLMQKLEELNRAVNQPAKTNYPVHNDPPGEDLEKLRAMMQSSNTQPENDTELEQLNAMMDKVIRIQHPEMMKQQRLLQEKPVFKISATPAGDTITNGFYCLTKESVPQSSNAIPAVVDEDQSLVNGSIIKLRLLSDMYIKEEKIMAGTFVYGAAHLNGERLEIEVSSIRSAGSIYPVKLQIFDLDGMPGIYIPGTITREVAKQSADNGLQNMQIGTLDPSLAVQATATGISTVKNLLSKRVKMTKVFVKSGYKLLIKNQSI